MSNIQIGSGATLLHFTDREPATVIAVSTSGKMITIRQDKVVGPVNEGGYAYKFEADPNGTERKFSLRKDGRWLEVGQTGGVRLSLRGRDYYFDRSF